MHTSHASHTLYAPLTFFFHTLCLCACVLAQSEGADASSSAAGVRAVGSDDESESEGESDPNQSEDESQSSMVPASGLSARCVSPALMYSVHCVSVESGGGAGESKARRRGETYGYRESARSRV